MESIQINLFLDTEQSRVEMLESGRYLQQKGFEILPLLPYIYFVGSSSGLIIMCKNIISNQSDFEKLGRLDSDR